ncbi:cytochrome ubiquinol oxidase subunit I, partial [Escherichia coli]|uniref:cytochrome ubiquinol oxidase subunit I n=1 Tax=Escherichia coli TaxID=562 RepID=UPI001953762A
PGISIDSGWCGAEYGRQPWAIGEVLPVSVAHSNLTTHDLIFSLALICGLYTLFLIAEVFLLCNFARKGPRRLKTGRYHFEQKNNSA